MGFPFLFLQIFLTIQIISKSLQHTKLTVLKENDVANLVNAEL